MQPTAIYHTHQAMATRWQWWLVGPPEVDLTMLAQQAEESITTTEQLLNRYAATSEVTRLNRLPVGQATRVDPLLEPLLTLAQTAWQITNGWFDIAIPAATSAAAGTTRPTWSWSNETKLFTWQVPEAQLDFGGLAKGYMLDQLAQAWQVAGITSALIDAGSSSLLAWGTAPAGQPWQVQLHDPATSRRVTTTTNTSLAQPTTTSYLATVPLVDQALSYSATCTLDQPATSTLTPWNGQPIVDQRACVALTKSAAWAEILSTAALCMGEQLADDYIKEWPATVVRLAWLDSPAQQVRWYQSRTTIV